ncbi:programmed cell death 1 ligand 1-like [Oreochromis aureus]|uniref:programmed cell death 1 ligand 1-like n=1 Tax=Oreochromis aureus TaxID=47969 RepID=UPI0019540BBC|nr:programmed cell death 1 ligand 1-like [Oreochromis aureus]
MVLKLSLLFALSWTWVSFPCLVSAFKDQMNITAGQNVTLPCHAPNNIVVVEWSRADLEPEHVLVYRDGHFVVDEQHPSFKNRVDLQDRQMNDGDVSLILKDVTTNDTGTYECRVFKMGANRRKRANQGGDLISSIYLSVDPPGQTGGHTEDGGKSGSVGLIAGLIVPAVILVAAFLIYRKQKHDLDYQSPVEMNPV